MKKSLTLDNIEKAYFLGIGGIGMSALARFFNRLGIMVYGYDLTKTELTESLEAEGMLIHYSESPELIPNDVDIVIYTPAIPSTHKEWETLRSLQVPIFKRAEVLGLISRNYNTIAIAGTHGKTSTSALVAHLLRSSGLEATAFVGGIVKNFNTNFVFGESDWLVVEADEFDRSFLHLHPNMAVLLSLDPDHLDIYGTAQAMKETYKEFTLQIENGGTLLIHEGILNSIDTKWKNELLARDIALFSFGVHAGWFRAEEIRANNHSQSFDFYVGDNKILESQLFMPGYHNISNATAALGIGQLLKLDDNFLAEGLRNFEGIKRRFEYISRKDGRVVIDDYAHHPKEIKAAIAATRELYKDKKLTVIFQPHLYSRTRDLLDGFAEELAKADELILMPIYPAREKPIEGIYSERISELINNIKIEIKNHKEVMEYIESEEPELLLILGAGDISLVADDLNEKYNS